MAKNKGLSKAKDAKKDEFYTRYEDIQAELITMRNISKGKLFNATAMIPLNGISENS